MNQITTSEMELINSYSRKELTPEDVYVFTVKLCDNDIDSTNERFTVESLFALADLFIGKTGFIENDLAKNNQMIRIISCKVDCDEDKGTVDHEPYYRLMARVYMLRNDNTREMIENIEKGIVEEVSIGCSVNHSICSICHYSIYSPLCNHHRGEKYEVDGRMKLCFVELKEPTDVYEFLLVFKPPMTNQEALNELQASIESRNSQCHIETYKKAIEALKKQVPQKPVEMCNRSFVCSHCKQKVIRHQSFCDICGQALDWEGTNNENT